MNVMCLAAGHGYALSGLVQTFLNAHFRGRTIQSPSAKVTALERENMLNRVIEVSEMNSQSLSTPRGAGRRRQGLLAMDESNPTCNKRFARLGIPKRGGPARYRR